MRINALLSKLFLVLLVTLFLFFFAYFAYNLYFKNSSTNQQNGKLNSDDIVQKASSFLLNRKTYATGLFVYDYNLKTGKTEMKDNIVRQMGALYALAIAGDDHLDQKQMQELKDSLQKVLDYSELVEKDGRKILLYKYYDSNIAGALALLFAASQLYVSYDKTFLVKNENKLEALKNTLLYLKKTNGDYSSFISKKDGRDEIEKNMSDGYSTGEILNAFAIYLKNNPDDMAVKKAVLYTLKMLEKRGLENRYQGIYLWLMSFGYQIYSNEKLDKEFKEKVFAVVEEYHKHALNYLKFYKEGYNSCAHTEGLAMYIKSAKLQGKKAEKELAIYKKSISINKRLQINKENKEYILSSNHDIKEEFYNNKYALYAFLDNIKNAGTRIDYAQHCIVAFWAYKNIVE